MKLKEIRGKSEAELKEALDRLSRERFNLRSQAVTGALESPARSRNARREVARILTILGERARAPQTEKAAPAPAPAKPAKAPKAEKPAKATKAKTPTGKPTKATKTGDRA